MDQKPPGYSALVMRTYDEELSNILDIAGLPTGSGAGYGVGVADDEFPALDLRYFWCAHFIVYIKITCIFIIINKRSRHFLSLSIQWYIIVEFVLHAYILN